jgi:hypothetical protein
LAAGEAGYFQQQPMTTSRLGACSIAVCLAHPLGNTAAVHGSNVLGHAIIVSVMRISARIP